jgi:UDP-glucose-4-epimerase GalE
VGDRVLVRAAIERHRIDAVIHFAANAAVAESMSNPFRYLHDNVASSLGLLEGMREAGCRTIVFSSSCATYGVPRRVPISESTPQSPVNPYGQSKLYVEQALQWYQRLHEFSWTALRYFNAAGADPDGETGEDHNPETHLIPSAIQAALGQAPTLPLCGTDYATPDGTAVRDYVHVCDLADAHIKALQYIWDGGVSRAFNLGAGRGYSVREVIATVERVGGVRIPVRDAPRRPGDPPTLIAETARARKTLGWQPRFTNLNDIVHTAWEWHASHRLRSIAAV